MTKNAKLPGPMIESGVRTAKNKLILAVTLTLAALAPAVASADSFILDTGIPQGSGAPVELLTSSFAAELYITAGETITQLSAYLTQGSGEVGSTFEWSLYSAAGPFLNSRNIEAASFNAIGTFSGNGWNSVAVDWTATTSGYYWIALSPQNDPGLDLPLETSDSTGTVPATAFAYTGTNHEFMTDTAYPVGIEVTATPLPAALPLFAGGFGVVAMIAQRRKRQVSVA
jgi:hypothetical protein